MLVNTPAIVLSTIKYSEADLIARIYTREFGTQSYMLKGVRKSKRGKIRPSYFLPLTQLQLQTQHKGKGTLEYIKDATVLMPYNQIHTDMVKSSIVLFFSEVFTQLLQDHPPDTDLYDYLSQTFYYLDQTLYPANYAIKVLLDITYFMGFMPDTQSIDQPYLNMIEGRFDQLGNLPHHASLENSQYVKQFLGIKIDAINTIKMSRHDRNQLLSMVVDYIQIHWQVFNKPNSLTILKQLFD